jgi:amidohydrolase
VDGVADVVALRRALHRIPELGFEEHRTAAALREALAGLGPVAALGATGLTLDLGPPDASRTLLLRADMDGLPIGEETGLAYASEHPGRMHACGHDAHMAALAAAAGMLAPALPPDLRVRLLFQPAEEGAGGARDCIARGALAGVDAAFGLHIWNELPVGTVAVTAGGVMAGVVELELTVAGRGGHGAMPHQAADPVVAAAHLVLALQNLVSRRASPFEPVVLTLGAIAGGEAFNVIPDAVRLRGTVRTFSREVDATVQAQLREVAAGVAAATGTRIDVQWLPHCIPTVNDAGFAGLVREAVADVPGLHTVLTDYRTMAGEDFGDILAEVPGAYVLVGSGDAAAGLSEPHHSPRFAFSEAVLPLARDLHLAVARRYGQKVPTRTSSRNGPA